MKVRPYTEVDAEKWDHLVYRSACGTFLHTRKFLSYHGRRFSDISLICEDKKGHIAGVLPAALKPDDPGCVSSHPGATYGGLIHERGLAAGDVERMIAGIVEHCRSRGFQYLEYKSVPPHLHSSYSQADVHAIWKRGGEIVRRDLWSVASLDHPPGYSKHHMRELARAHKSDIVIGMANTNAEYHGFHAVLAACLSERHGATPAHTADEMLQLRERFPQNIALWLARDGNDLILAGSWVFIFPGRAWHTQYIATSPEGRSRGAGYLVVDAVVREAAKSRAPFVSFGSSTDDDRQALNVGLLEFKSGFGAGALCHDIYRLRLTT